MWDGYCGKVIRTLNRNMLIGILLVFAGLIGFFGYNGRYFVGFFQGARPISGADLASMNPGSAADRFVRVQSEKTVRSGIAHRITDDSHPQGYVDSRYLLAAVNGQPLIVRTAGYSDPVSALVSSSTSFEGRLRPVPHDLGSLLSSQASTLGNPSLPPFYLDTEDYREFGYLSLVFGVPVLLLGCWMLWRYLLSSSEYANHPFARRLAKYGQLERLVQQVDAEMAGAHTTVKSIGVAELTPHWIIAKNSYAAIPMRLDRVVWVYRLIVKRKAYFVTIQKMYSVVAFDNIGQKLTVQLTDSQTTQILTDIAAAAPQAIVGYDKGLAKVWRSSKDKTAFLQAARSQFATAAGGDHRSTLWR